MIFPDMISQEYLEGASCNEEPTLSINCSSVTHKSSPSCQSSPKEHVAKEMELHILQVDQKQLLKVFCLCVFHFQAIF